MPDFDTLVDDALPPSVLEMLRNGDGDDEPALSAAQLLALTATLLDTRKLYRDYRRTSGVEDIWLRNEEAYIGMDDGNRHEFGARRIQVPSTMEGPLRKEKLPVPDGRCTLYVRLTARYVDAGAAKLQEILLPPDEKSFSYDPTPVPELIERSQSEAPVLMPDGSPAERDATPGEMRALPTPLPQTPDDPTVPPTVPMVPGVNIKQRDLAQEEMATARKKAKKAEQQVQDWKVEAQHPATMRRVIADAARLGVGVQKGPFPCLRKARAISTDPATGDVTLDFQDKLAPDWKAISPWNLFPSPSCGEVVRNGEGLFERDYLSRTQVEDLADLPGYIHSAIALVLTEGAQKQTVDNSDPSHTPEDTRYEVWYWYGSLAREEWEAIQGAGSYTDQTRPRPLPEDQHSVYAIVTLINDSIVYASINPLKSGTIPFYTFPWQNRPGSWAGIGIAEQIADPQRMVVAAVRALLDNAGVSAGAQIVMDRDAITPFDGNHLITKMKLWQKSPECDDVRKAFTVFQIPNITAQMITIYELGCRIAEESCNIPLISQGQSGETTPDTFGATQLQNNNANQLLRGIAATYDDSTTEPESRATYEWYLLDPTIPKEDKGEFQINARGSSALVERAIQDQAAVQVLELVAKAGDALGADPKKTFTEYLKAKRLDPANYQYTKEELDAKAKEPPPKAPQVQAAEISAQVALKKAQMDSDRDTIYSQAQTEQTRVEHEVKMQELALKRELELLKYANDQKLTLMQVKSDLAQTSLKLQTQKELSVLSAETAIHKHSVAPAATPPTEPAGRAETGKAFEQ